MGNAVRKTLYLVSYDIVCTKRRNKVFKRLDYLDNAKRLMDELSELVEPSEDKLFCVTLNTQGYCFQQQPQDEAIELIHEHPLLNQLLGGWAA